MLSIRQMREADVATAAAIEQHEVSAWSKNLIGSELGCAQATLLVACNNSSVIGWCCARMVGEEAELLKIGVTPVWRRRSVGTALFAELLERLLTAGVELLLLEVRSRNKAALGFYSGLGFTAVGRRIRYYSHPGDDALIMKKSVQ